MTLLHSWKIGAAAVLLGAIAIGLVPRDSAATVRQVIAGEQPQVATLEGAVEVLRPNHFLLRDQTGAIRLETCPSWYRLLPLHPGEQVRIQGELAPRSRWHMDQPVFIVHRLRRQDGEEIVLRYNQGPPPWQKETWRASTIASDE
jgi:uncharacterized protein YdeI (BOF family)